MNKRVSNLVKKYKEKYGKRLTDRQYEQLARAALTGRVWGIRHSFKINRYSAKVN